jgi:hypothetical protein
MTIKKAISYCLTYALLIGVLYWIDIQDLRDVASIAIYTVPIIWFTFFALWYEGYGVKPIVTKPVIPFVRANRYEEDDL